MPATRERRFPYVADVLPGRLAVRVYRHDATAAHLPCWTYVTDGLRHRMQPEISLTLVRHPEEEPGAFPGAPLDLFALIFGLAEQGRVVGSGDLTEFGEDGFLGRAAIRALAYLPPQRIADIEPPGPFLTALFLLDDERQVARACGLSRIASRLSRVTAHWPFPFWTERDRPPVASAGELSSSVLAGMPHLFVGGATSLLQDETVELSFSRRAAAQFAAELSKLPPNAALAVFTSLDVRADSWLTWQPGQTKPEAVGLPGGDGSRIAGCWCAFVPEQAHDQAQIFEDGFVVMLRDATWATVRAALETGGPVQIPGEAGGRAFRLRWV